MSLQQIPAPPAPDRKPRDDEMDIFGLTHAGRVRTENQDRFLVCSLRRTLYLGHWPRAYLLQVATAAATCSAATS